MRKEVFYSLMAMTVVPGAANATDVNGNPTPGAVIPDVVSFNDLDGIDLDGDLKNDVIQWRAGDITFNINKKLVPGLYTFKAHLISTAAAVWVKIPGAVVPGGTKAVDEKQNMTDASEGRDIEVHFEVKEETSNLAITIHPATDYTQADNKYYFIGKSTDEGSESGLSFDEVNFTNALQGLNALIDNYVNKVFNTYESQLAWQTMNAAKEKLQGMITNVSDLTYDDYVNNGFDGDLKESPIFKWATKLFNQSTRIEADYQANNLKKQMNAALEASKKDILDENGDPTGEKTDVNPYLEKMVEKALGDIKEYEDRADKKTGATIADGKVQGGSEAAAAELDPKILEEGGFDVDPNFPPLKNLQQEANRVSMPGGYAHIIADSLQIAADSIDVREADLKKKFDEMAELYPTDAKKYKDAALAITDYYRKYVFDAIKAEVYDKSMSIPKMTKEFKSDITTRLKKAVIDQVSYQATYIKDFYTLYYNYLKALADAASSAGEKPALTPEAEERYGKTDEYLTRSQKYDQLLENAKKKFTLPDLKTPKDKDEYVHVLNKEANDSTANLNTLNVTTINTGNDGVMSAKYAADFAAYVNGLNKLDAAWTAWEEAKQKGIDAYDEENGGYANDKGYDNRKFFKEEFLNYWYKITNAGKSNEEWTATTYVSKPGTPEGSQVQDDSYYTHEQFLEKMKKQLEDMWGEFTDNVYDTHKVVTLDTYSKDNTSNFIVTLTTFISQLENATAPGKVYADRAKDNAKTAQEVSDNLTKVKEAIQQLRDRVANSPIYSAKPVLYAADPENMDGNQTYTVPVEDEDEPNTREKDITYTIPAEVGTGNAKSWKQILFDFETKVKGFDADWAKVIDEKDEANVDNSSKNEHSLRLVRLRNKLRALFENSEFKDAILKNIEDFVKEGGVIDQQEALYADNAAEDNFNSWMEFLDPDEGVIAALAERIQLDREGPNGYTADTDEDGKDDYFVGYDQPNDEGELDGEISDGELVNFKDDWTNIPAYDYSGSLNSDKKAVFTALINSFSKKRVEAQAIFEKYDQWPTDGDGDKVRATWNAETKQWENQTTEKWTTIDFEKANVELAQAAAMVEEVNGKLEKEFEQPLVKEIKAQDEHENIREKIFNTTAKDADELNLSNMAGLKYNNVNIKRWDNGRKGVSYKKMGDCENLFADFNPLIQQLVNDGPADQEAYDEAKAALNPNDLPIYERIEAVYKRALQLRKDMNDAYLQGNPQEQWENGKQLEYKQIEAEIKSIVTDCGKEEADIVANQEALKALQELDNVDADNGNGEYDWNDLFDVDEDGNFIIKDLLGTSGYQKIAENDAAAESAADFLEPTYVNKNGEDVNTHAFQKMLANPTQLAEIEEEVIAASRAFRADADEATGGVYYEALKAFIAKVKTAYEDRTLGDKIDEFKEEFDKLAQNILLIDEHAAANKKQHDAMLAIIENLQESIDEARKTVEETMMEGSAARFAAEKELANAERYSLGRLQTMVDEDYKNGIAWQDGTTTDENIKKEETEEAGKVATEVATYIDNATGSNSSVIAKANQEKYEQFVADYDDANKMYSLLVQKLEQLKNLDADVDATLKEDCEATAQSVNTFLFGQVKPNEQATESAKDKLDRIYNEGVASYNPLKAWDPDYVTNLADLKEKIADNINGVDARISQAITIWNNAGYSTDDIKTSAEYAYINYFLHTPARLAVNSMPDKTTAEQEAKEAAKTAAVKAVITGNENWDALYSKIESIENNNKAIQDTKSFVEFGTVEFGTYKFFSKMLDINALFDDMKFMDENYAAEKQAGADAEAQKDLKIFTDFADAHLAEDQEALEKLGIALDEEIEGAANTMQEVLDEYAGIFVDEDGNSIEITKDNHGDKLDAVLDIIGGYSYSTNPLRLTSCHDGKCSFVHQLVKNANKANHDANLATLTSLEGAIKEAAEYINQFQVGPKYADKLQKLQDKLDEMKEFVQDPDVIRSNTNITATVNDYKITLGKFPSSYYTRLYDPNNLGTMYAEDGSLPVIVNDAWKDEKTRLKADINTLRAEFKAGTFDEAVNTQIESLWNAVEGAECKKVTEKQTDKDGKNPPRTAFKEWKRDDLSGVQDDIKALYKQIREANGTAIDADALVASLTARLDAVKTTVESDYARNAPTVKKRQAELETLIAAAQHAIDAAQEAGDVDYDRERLTDMVLNAENMLRTRDAAAQKVDDAKANALKKVESLFVQINDSKDKVNRWVDDEYDLAGNENSAEYYDDAQEFASAYAEVVDGYLADYDFDAVDEPSEEDEKLLVDFDVAINSAEVAAAQYDLNKRLSDLTAQTNQLKVKLENNVYEEDVVKQAEELITDIEEAIEEEHGKASDPTSVIASYESIREAIAKYEEDLDGELELTDGIQFDINKLAELLAFNVIGDINGDGKVSLIDARMLVDIVMGKADMPVYGTEAFTAADVNGDGMITITDASCAVNLFFYGNIWGPDGEPADEARSLVKSDNKLNVEAATTDEGLTRLTINLDNAAQFTAFQMDLQLPEGIKLAAAKLGDRADKQFLMTNMLEDNVLRLAAMSYKNEAITGNSGAVLYLDFEVADGAQDEFARFNNVFFVKDGKQFAFELGGVTPTGITSANAETALGQKIYDLGGRAKNSLKKGVNILIDAAGNAKKVFKK